MPSEGYEGLCLWELPAPAGGGGRSSPRDAWLSAPRALPSPSEHQAACSFSPPFLPSFLFFSPPLSLFLPSLLLLSVLQTVWFYHDEMGLDRKTCPLNCVSVYYFSRNKKCLSKKRILRKHPNTRANLHCIHSLLFLSQVTLNNLVFTFQAFFPHAHMYFGTPFSYRKGLPSPPI